MLILVMHVTGERRSNVGKRLAGRLRLRFIDTDDFRPDPLSRISRGPNPTQLAQLAAEGAVLACADAPAQLGALPHQRVLVDPHVSEAEAVERAACQLVRAGAIKGTLRVSAQDAEQPLTTEATERLLDELVAGFGPVKRVLLLPPDATRAHSAAGELAVGLYRRLSPQAEVKLLPALGTHEPMSETELGHMFPGIPLDRFLVHDFRSGVTTLGEVPGSFVSHVSGGKVDYAVPCQVSREIASGTWDRIVSIGQLVPHEVIGIANHSKNVFVGTGGKESIDRSHFLGAVCGMESMMGQAHTPVRDVLNYMSAQIASALPLTYLCTVRKKDEQGQIQTHGLFAGDDEGCFLAGAPLVQRLNLDLLDRPLEKVVVYLDPHEFRTTWLGNKALYRTRMAIADGGELTVLGPGVRRFGEDAGIDRLIRRHGYRGTEHTLAQVKRDPELGASLSAAAHLIHGSSEGRFKVRWAAGGLTPDEVRSVGYDWAEVGPLLERYSPARLQDGFNRLPDGEEIFFVSNPGLGLWAFEQKFSR